MRLLRLALILLTIASLPGYGLAGTGHVRACPESGAPQSAAEAMPGMDMQAASPAQDCSAGAGHTQQPAKGKSGSCPACLAGHGCQGTQGAQPPGILILTLMPLRPSVVEEPSPHASLCGPDGLLRPPELT
jgi:hypothetical protein